MLESNIRSMTGQVKCRNSTLHATISLLSALHATVSVHTLQPVTVGNWIILFSIWSMVDVGPNDGFRLSLSLANRFSLKSSLDNGSEVKTVFRVICLVSLDVVKVRELVLPFGRVFSDHDPALHLCFFGVVRLVLLVQLPLVQLYRGITIVEHPSSFDDCSLGSHSLDSFFGPWLTRVVVRSQRSVHEGSFDNLWSRRDHDLGFSSL